MYVRCTIYRAYVQWSPIVRPHYRQAYVAPLWASAKLLFLEVPNVIRLKLRVLGFRLSGSTKGSG
jgi:hypothetical protein